jgi:hypothetical protein
MRTVIKGRSNARRITPFSPAQGTRAKTDGRDVKNSDTRGSLNQVEERVTNTVEALDHLNLMVLLNVVSVQF